MKHFLFLSFLLLPVMLWASQNDTTLSKEDQTMPWHSSVYLELGYGYPQGFRLDFGGHFSHHASLGLSFSSGNYLSYFPHDNELGVYAEITIPFYSVITPYFRGAVGFGGSPQSQLANTYYSLTGGTLISLTPVLQWRIECGAINNDVHVPYGVSYSSRPYIDTSIIVPEPDEFGPVGPIVHQTLFYFQTGIEIDMGNIPWKRGKM